MVSMILHVQNQKNTKQYLILKLKKYPFVYRNMISARCIYASRAIFHTFKAITNNDILTSKNDFQRTTELKKSIIDLHHDHSMGAVQHKNVVSTILLPTKKFNTNDLSPLIVGDNIEIPRDIQHDGRVFKEITAQKEMIEKYGPFHKVYMNFDSKDIISYRQNQLRQDFVFHLYGNDDSIILRPMDEKAGSYMLETSSKGTIGILTYDISSGTPENIPILTYPVTPFHLLECDKRNLKNLAKTLINDSIEPSFSEKIWEKGTVLLKNPSNKPLLELHEAYASYVWEKVQKNPLFKRSVSTIITKQVDFKPFTKEEDQFHHDFYNLLEPRMYNLSKYGDRIHVMKAAFYAFSRHDPDLALNLKHLHKQGLLNDDFFDMISKSIIKT